MEPMTLAIAGVAALAILLIATLGAGLVLITSTETLIAANFRTSSEVFYAADAVVGRAIVDLRTEPEWSRVLDGTARSAFVDGPPSGTRRLPDGGRVDLSAVINMANCGRTAPCSLAEMAEVRGARPWGANNPNWRLFAYGWLDDLLEGAPRGSLCYVVAMVGDDGSENDGDPLRDGFRIGVLPNPGAGVLLVRAEAFGPRASHYAIEAVIQHFSMDESDPASPVGLRLRSWHVVH